MVYALLAELADHQPLFATPVSLFAQQFARAVLDTDRKTTTGKQRRAVHQLSGGKVSLCSTPRVTLPSVRGVSGRSQ
jgi:hypothetical protein